MLFYRKQKWFNNRLIVRAMISYIFFMLLHMLVFKLLECENIYQMFKIELTGQNQGKVLVFTEFVYLLRSVPVLYVCNNDIQGFFHCRNYIAVRCKSTTHEFLFLQKMILGSLLGMMLPRLIADITYGICDISCRLILWLLMENLTLLFFIQVLVILMLMGIKAQSCYFAVLILLLIGPWTYGTIPGIVILPMSAAVIIYPLLTKLGICSCFMVFTSQIIANRVRISGGKL